MFLQPSSRSFAYRVGHEIQAIPVGLLGLVVEGSLGFPLELEGLDDTLVLPANFVAKTSERAVPAPWVEPEHTQCRRHYHALHAVVRRWHALEDLQAVQGKGATLRLVWQHATHSPPQDLAGCPKVVGPSLWVHIAPLAQKVQVLQLIPEEAPGYADPLASHDHHPLAMKQCLRY